MPPSAERVRRRVAVVVVLVAMLCVQVVLLYTESAPGAPLFPGSDKVGHALIFGGPVAAARLLGVPWGAVLFVAHALVSEPLQAWFTTSRVADPWDLAADGVGMAAGWLLAGWWLWRGR